MASDIEPISMEKIVSLAKRRGFIFPGSEIYGGLAGTWDYGPLGVLMKDNIKRAWWENIVGMRDEVFGVDAAICHPFFRSHGGLQEMQTALSGG